MDNILKSIFPHLSDTDKKQIFYIEPEEEPEEEPEVELTQKEIEDVALESIREEERRRVFIIKALKNKKRRRK